MNEHYYVLESEYGYELYVSNLLEGESKIINHIATIYDELHARMVCRFMNAKLGSIGAVNV